MSNTVISVFTVNLEDTQSYKCSIKEAVVKNFAIFTGKHLCRSLFLINFANFLKETPIQIFCSKKT